jgi:hypothetical protein
VLFIAPQKSNQSNYSDKQCAHVVQSIGSQATNDWPKENQNIHQACCNSPGSRRGFSIPDDSPSHSSDSGHNDRKQHVDEQVGESLESVMSTNCGHTPKRNLAACGLSSAEVGHVLDDLAAVARPVRLAFRWRPRLSDPDDDMVLETAINGGASAIVTFNQRDFADGIRGFSCAVILPAMALQQVRSVIHETK